MGSVLAVDDSTSMRKLIASTLTHQGYDVLEASDGEEALAIARKNSVSLVITDVNMPKMDGITLVGELRKLREYRFTPILVLTTEMEPQKKKKAKDAGATGWLVKPFDPEVLMSTIRRVIP